jgi:hypothetical protein
MLQDSPKARGRDYHGAMGLARPLLVDSPILLCHRLQKRQKLAVLAAESYDLRALPSLTLCSLRSRKGGSVRVVSLGTLQVALVLE